MKQTWEPCPVCHASGEVRAGFYPSEPERTTCRTCNGKGALQTMDYMPTPIPYVPMPYPVPVPTPTPYPAPYPAPFRPWYQPEPPHRWTVTSGTLAAPKDTIIVSGSASTLNADSLVDAVGSAVNRAMTTRGMA